MVSSQWISNGPNIYYTGGNVGIGVALPTQKLEVDGTIAPAFGTATSATYRFGNGLENTGFSSPDFNTISVINNGVQTLRIDGSGRVGIGPATVAPSAQLEVTSTTRGILPPRMTNVQMYAIISPAEGLTVYNTSLKTLCWFNGTSWSHAMEGKSCGSINYGGHTYETVIIGQQCWMKENLNIGILIPNTSNQVNNGVIEKYCAANLESNCAIYGAWYSWDEIMNYAPSGNGNPSGRQGICPPGWHIPSDAEYTQLSTYLGGVSVAGGKMKESGTEHWAFNTGATNSSGFTALPGGFHDEGGYTFQADRGYLWTSTEANSTDALYRAMYSESTLLYSNELNKAYYGLSGRCCKD
jgi:uncharacterized protein (TIGR02145 family)